MKKYLALLAILLANHFAYSQWSNNPAINNAICTDYYNQAQIQMVSDGSGGTIFTWVDSRFQPSYTIFCQRINSSGNVQWAANGIQVSSSSVNNAKPAIVADGSGGAIICWTTNGYFGNLYAQRINSSGAIQWVPGGILVCSGTPTSTSFEMVSDGNGGCIVAWNDSRNNEGGNEDDVYAQRINGAGLNLWTANGVPVASTIEYQGSLQLASDGSGGAVIVWEDQRSSVRVEIYTQKVNSLGIMQWTTNGVLVNSIPQGSLYPQIISDAGGAIICWVDRRNAGTGGDIYAQKLNSTGNEQWTANGLPVCLAIGNQSLPQLTNDGAGGAIITWDEDQSAAIPDPNIYAQRVNASGAVQWGANGVGVCLAANAQHFPNLTPDGVGGIVITWQDNRTGIWDICAQRLNASGAALWTINGVVVSNATFVQIFPVIVSAGNNGMIIGWQDLRNDLSGNRHDIFAQRVNLDGTLGNEAPGDADGDGYTVAQGDCNDNNPAIHPGATELCNGVDDNCDGQIDEGVKTTFYRDADTDGYGNAAVSTQACTAPAGYVSNSTDCNDANIAIHPGATELCNGVDDDCDGLIDEGAQTTFYRDADTDGYGNAALSTQACTAPAGYVSNSTDCNDANIAIHPGATEVCNGVDDDCDGSIDEGVKTTYYRDADTDGYGNAANTTQACTVPAGYVTNSTDCNDANAAVHPGAIEVCNGVDDDCDGSIDEGVKTTFYRDADTDGYGNAAVTTQACTLPAGYVSNSTDCNDANAAVNPGVTEVCGNGIDDNCNGQVDEGCTNVSLSIADVTVNEAVGNAIVSVTLSAPAGNTVTVKYRTINGTARHPKDYIHVSGTLTFNPGETNKNIMVAVVADAIPEADQDFFIELSKSVNAPISDASGTVTITEAAPLRNLKDNPLTEALDPEESKWVVPSPQRKTESLRFYGLAPGSFDLVLTNANGEIVTNLRNYRNDFSMARLAPGLYFYQLLYKNNKSELKRKTGKILVTD
ncbi:MAG: MopE-related protein [Chitinophagaceae bacterium]